MLLVEEENPGSRSGTIFETYLASWVNSYIII